MTVLLELGSSGEKKFHCMFSLFDTDHECDGQTDRQTDMQIEYPCKQCLLQYVV